MNRWIAILLILAIGVSLGGPAMADDVDFGLKIGKDQVARFEYDSGHNREVWMFAAVIASGAAIGSGLYFGLRDRRTHIPHHHSGDWSDSCA